MTNQYDKITIDNVRHEIYRQARREAENWFLEQSHNPYAAYYLYIKKSTEKEWGELRLDTQPLNGDFELASPYRFHAAHTRENVISKIVELSQRLPVIPFGR